MHLKPCIGMIRADVSYLNFEFNPKGILLLCSGSNSDASYLLEDRTWVNFSKDNSLILMALSFASKPEDLKNGNGYYYASKGSGQLLLQAIEKIYRKKIPIYIYGFSGGAHFTSRFVEWAPNRIGSWCAHSAGWWDSVREKTGYLPMGIVACGKEDNRYTVSLRYFNDGRIRGRKWTWVALKNTNHLPSKKLDNFVRMYFAIIMHKDLDLCLVDNKTLKIKKANDRNNEQNLSYLPSVKLFHEWKSLSY